MFVMSKKFCIVLLCFAYVGCCKRLAQFSALERSISRNQISTLTNSSRTVHTPLHSSGQGKHKDSLQALATTLFASSPLRRMGERPSRYGHRVSQIMLAAPSFEDDDARRRQDKDFALNEELRQRLMESRRQSLGPEHPDTLEALNDYASILSRHDNFEKAEALMNTAVYLCRKVLGPRHPYTLKAYETYADTLQLKKQKLDLSQQLFGRSHPDTIKALHVYANTLAELDREAEAEQLKTEFKQR